MYLEANGDAGSRESSFEGKTVIVCLGNPYMKDDAIALKAAGRLREKHLEDRAFVIKRH